MRRSERRLHLRVGFRPRVLVKNDDRDRSANGLPLEDAAQNLALILLRTRRDDFTLPRPAAIQIALDFLLGNFDPRRAAIHRHADRATVRFAEGGDAETVTVLAGHGALRDGLRAGTWQAEPKPHTAPGHLSSSLPSFRRSCAKIEFATRKKMRNFARRPSSEIRRSRRCSRASDFARSQQGHDRARRMKIQSRSKLSVAVFGVARRGYPAASHPESARRTAGRLFHLPTTSSSI